MIRNAWAALPLFLLSSCGIISIEYLPPPPVALYTNQTDFTKLVFTHVASTYSSNPDFQGYEVYYKVYALAESVGLGIFDTLAADNSQLIGVTPTKDYLVTLGYQRMSLNDQNSGSVPIVSNLSDGDDITLDFNDITQVDGGFLSKMNVPNPPGSVNHTSPPIPPKPVIKVGPLAAPTSTAPVFRSVSISGVFSYPWFSDLYRTWAGGTSDMKLGTTTAAINSSTDKYEIDVFLVAYSFTPEQTIYSQPVPWGVISELDVDL